jgi:hypothetical protein
MCAAFSTRVDHPWRYKSRFVRFCQNAASAFASFLAMPRDRHLIAVGSRI